MIGGGIASKSSSQGTVPGVKWRGTARGGEATSGLRPRGADDQAGAPTAPAWLRSWRAGHPDESPGALEFVSTKAHGMCSSL